MFISNCNSEFTTGGKYKVLGWNMVGTVCLRQEMSYTSIDVDFTDKQTHKNVVINDDYGAVMAVLSNSGLLIASKGTDDGADEEELEEFIDEDMEMEDEEKKRRRYAHIYYKPVNTWKSSKDWHFKLQKREQVECLAMGSGWSVVATDFGYLRAFSNEGIQRNIICHGTPFVTMGGYENLLAVVYHAGPSVYGCQVLKMKIIDMSPTGPTSY